MNKHIFWILISVILVFGLGWPVAKIGLQYMPPITFSAVRLSIATLTMFLVTIVTRNFIWPTRQDWPIILAIGLLQMGIFLVLMHVGLSLVAAGRSAILVYSTPLWVTPIAVLFLKERAGFLKWLGLTFGISGIITLFGPWGINWHSTQDLVGNLILILAALSWAIAIICARHMRWYHSSLALVPWQLLVGMIPVIGAVLFIQPETKTIEWNWSLIGALLFTGVLAQALGAWGAIMVSKTLPAVTTSLSFLAVPVSGLLFSSWILNEPLTLINIVAMILIIIGLICTALDRNKLA